MTVAPKLTWRMADHEYPTIPIDPSLELPPVGPIPTQKIAV
jgi:hypothetical protein